jgi:two-component system OmpR family response regulator
MQTAWDIPGIQGASTLKLLSRILMVEDEPDIQAVARMALVAIGGFEVEICSSGREALDRLASSVPDLVLMDVMMPGMDGPSALREMRSNPAMADVPVIFMTAKVQSHEIARYMEIGALGVIAKPFDPMTLASTVSSIWEKNHVRNGK